MDCKDCGIGLRTSVHLMVEREGRRLIWKSCPRCSQRNGVLHEFKLLVELDEDNQPIPSTSDFGFTHHRRNPSNPLGSQSLCGECRSNDEFVLPGLIRSKVGGVEICFGSWNDISDKIW